MKDLPPSEYIIASPHDMQVRYSTKREQNWMGYKVDLIEICDETAPHVVTNVETTPATVPDDHRAEVIYDSLAQRDLFAAEYLVDNGYTDSTVLVDSPRGYGVKLVGPIVEDPS